MLPLAIEVEQQIDMPEPTGWNILSGDVTL